jgi:hypothetical protein
MNETITKKFADSFDTKNEIHVKWFKSLHDATQNEKSVDKVLSANPFGIKPSKVEMLEWVNVQFILAMKYAHSVLEGNAWVPAQKLG